MRQVSTDNHSRAFVTRRTAVVALTGTLAAQLFMVGSIVRSTPREIALQVGEELPFSVAALVHPGRQTDPVGTCTQAFLCTTSCPFCARLATLYADSLRAETPTPLRPIWLVIGDSASTVTWADTHRLARSRVFTLGPKEGPWFKRPVMGDVWFTPTRVVLTSSSVVMDSRPGDTLLNQLELASLCDGGGAAVRSMEELEGVSTSAEGG